MIRPSGFPFPRAIVIALVFTLILILIIGQHKGVSPASISDTWRSLSSNVQEDSSEVQRSASQVKLGANPLITFPKDTPGNLKDVQNSTLGFQKIYILSLPNRSDKRDALVLSSWLTGLEIEFVDGVNGTLISDRAYPQNGNMRDDLKTMGCWRGHMEIYQKMVREHVQTALIMEDDADWDVMIKAQFTQLAIGTRQLQKSTLPMTSPYGDDWDIMATGHCGVENDVEFDQDYYISHDDPTVPAPEDRHWGLKPNLTPQQLQGNYSRSFFATKGFYCLASYAVSMRGAARIIYDQAILPNARGIDSGLKRLCGRYDYGGPKCIGTAPSLTGIHLPAGDMSRDSDRRGTKGERKIAESRDLVFPVRLNLFPLLKGEKAIKAQYPEHAMLKEMDVSTLELPWGQLVSVKKEEYIVEESQANRRSVEWEGRELWE